MLKHISILLALLFGLCEAQQQDLNKIKVELEDLDTKLLDASRSIGIIGAHKIGDIVQQIKNKCSNDIYENAQVISETFFKYLQEINGEIAEELITVGNVLKILENKNIDQQVAEEIVKDFAQYKKNIVDGLMKSKEFIDLQYGELNRMLKTCSASKPANKTVPQTGGTANIPHAPVTLIMVAALIAIKLVFH
uniref:Putative secreted protein n=1 Tax=Panstrongylus lignarius TaxID=156445 RepID=A0A224XXH1_9HEMI